MTIGDGDDGIEAGMKAVDNRVNDSRSGSAWRGD